jgi:hypothetical protein
MRTKAYSTTITSLHNSSFLHSVGQFLFFVPAGDAILDGKVIRCSTLYSPCRVMIVFTYYAGQVIH